MHMQPRPESGATVEKPAKASPVSMTVAAAVMLTTVGAVPTALVMPAVVGVVMAAAMMRRRCVAVTAAPPTAPVGRADRIRCRTVGWVGVRRSVVEGLGAGGDRGQQSQSEGEVDPAHVGFLPF